MQFKLKMKTNILPELLQKKMEENEPYITQNLYSVKFREELKIEFFRKFRGQILYLDQFLLMTIPMTSLNVLNNIA